MQIEIDKLVRARRRTIALIVERDGSLTVRAPKRAALRDIEHFIREKAGWILRTREKLLAIPEIARKEFIDGEMFLFMGREYELKLVPPQRPALKFDDGFRLGTTAQGRAGLLFTRWYKEQALRVISERVQHYAALHGFQPKQVKISSAKTRWGSCTSTGNLNFTWRLVMAPLEVIDYVVIHELAHLRVHNHSAKFWKLVESIDPQFKARRKWLRLNGETLNL
jgi:predicted metal-dependent hydrolase